MMACAAGLARLTGLPPRLPRAAPPVHAAVTAPVLPADLCCCHWDEGDPKTASTRPSAAPSAPFDSRGTEGHNTASIGGFVTLPPVIMGSLRDGVEAAQVRLK